MALSDGRLIPHLFHRRVQLSLFFFIPIFLILFSFAPAYLVVTLLSQAALSSGAAGQSAFHSTMDSVLGIFFFTGIAATAVGLVIAYALVKPVRDLQRAMTGVGLGRRDSRLRLETTEEFLRVSDEFNRMVGKLRLQDRLAQTERLAAVGTLAAGLAHEIRNPLGALKGTAQLLEEAAAGDEAKSYARRIAAEADRLNRLVDRLLHLAEEPSGRTERFDLNRLIRDVLEITQTERTDRNVTVAEKYGDLPKIEADREALVQAVLNLVLNAGQATTEPGRIRIETRAVVSDDGIERVILEIGNTGSSIPREDYQRIFDPFFTTKPNGTGLGLAITHQIVTAHGGTIQVRSDAGETVFVVELPVNRKDAVGAQDTASGRESRANRPNPNG